jgi:Hint domain
MSHDTRDLHVKVGRTRRSMMSTVAIAASAIVTLASMRPGVAGPPGPPAGPPGPPGGPPGPPGGPPPLGGPPGPPGGPPDPPQCFLRGTTIRTAEGNRKIEELAVGDLLPTMFGGSRPIQWIGHFPIKKSDPSKPWPKDARPVRIARSALAPNVPQADLYVSQAHGVFIDGVLASAGYLVNGATITLCDASELRELEFFHIKLENHDVIYAEGAPVESLLEVDDRAVNFADYFRKYGVPTGEELPCLPFLSNCRRRGLKSLFGAAISWNDRRKRIGVIRNRLRQRAIALSQELEPSF